MLQSSKTKEVKVYCKPLDIEVFPETLEFRFGKAKFSALKKFGNPKQECHTLREILGKHSVPVARPKQAIEWIDGCPEIEQSVEPHSPTPFDLKGLYKTFSDTMGITPKAALKLMNNLGWGIIVDEFTPTQVFKYCYPRGFKRQLSHNRVKKLHELKATVKQALADNQENLVPLILETGLSPKQIKDSVPRYVWKSIINNSFTKNLQLASYRDYIFSYSGNTVAFKYATLRTSTLEVFNCREVDYETICITEKLAIEKKILTKKKSYIKLANIVKDTIKMAEELGKECNLKWKAKRWEEEHLKMTREINALKYSPEIITKGIYSILPIKVETPDGVATLLRSALDVACEGNTMNHCVGSYAKQCSKGEYIVYHIITSEDEDSTLGINVYPDRAWHGLTVAEVKFQQHYAHSNQTVSSKAKLVREQVMKAIREAQEAALKVK